MTLALAALDAWLKQFRTCVFLEPVNESLYLVCAPSQYTGALAWAELNNISGDHILLIAEVLKHSQAIDSQP